MRQHALARAVRDASWTLSLLLLLAPAMAEGASGEAEAGLTMPAPITWRTASGLDVAFVREPTQAEVAVCATYRAGSAAAAESKRASARLAFEALSQLTSTDVSRSSRTLKQRGGRESSQLTADRAQFCTYVPKTELPFALWQEANRLAGASLDIGHVETARARALEGMSTGPRSGEGAANARLMRILFAGHPVYGAGLQLSAEALQKVPFSEIQAFFAHHYQTSTAAIAVVGNVTEAQVRTLIERHFSGKNVAVAAPAARAQRFAQASERYSTLIDNNAKAPLLLYGWAIPSSSEDVRARLALELVGSMLGQTQPSPLGGPGAMSRLGLQTLQVRLQTSLNTFEVMLAGTALMKPEVIHADLTQFFLRLANVGPTEAELSGARTAFKSELAATLADPLARASWLSERCSRQQLLQPDRILEQVERIAAAEIRAATAKYLLPTQRTLVELYPTKWYEPGPPIPRYHLVKPGETLRGIARAERVTLAALLSANTLPKGKVLAIGQKLLLPKSTLPAPRLHRVRKGETLSGIARKYRTSAAALRRANGIQAKKPLMPGRELVLPEPVQ